MSKKNFDISHADGQHAVEVNVSKARENGVLHEELSGSHTYKSDETRSFTTSGSFSRSSGNGQDSSNKAINFNVHNNKHDIGLGVHKGGNKYMKNEGISGSYAFSPNDKHEFAASGSHSHAHGMGQHVRQENVGASYTYKPDDKTSFTARAFDSRTHGMGHNHHDKGFKLTFKKAF